MDCLYAKSQLAWLAQNARRAQDCIDAGDAAGAERELDLAERAVNRVRGEIAKLRQGVRS